MGFMQSNRPPSFAFALAATITAALGVLTACSSSQEAASGMRVEKTCLKTACNEKEEDSSCSRCLAACSAASYSCDSSIACRVSCGSREECSDDERSRCVSEAFVVRTADEPNADLLAACERMFDHLRGCEREIPGKTKSVCAEWAKVEKPETAQTYECVVKKGCGGDVTTCAPPPSMVGAELCDGLGAKCAVTWCTPDMRKALNSGGAAWKDDVIAAARSCLSLPVCIEARACLQSWVNAVHP